MSQNTIDWLVENQIILSKVYQWDTEGLASNINQANDLINQSDSPLVHKVWDLLDMETYPANINDIRKAIQPLFTNERLGWVIIILDNPMIGFLSQVGTSMYGVRYRNFKTMEDGLKYLQERDPTLPLLT